MRIALVLLVSGVLSWFTYGRLERLGRRALPAALARAVAWGALGTLLLDLTCALPGERGGRPLVLLDASLSMGAAGGQWRAALDTARALGDVVLFGDRGPVPDSLPAFGRSDLAPALRAAAASDRPVVVVTDGELTDRSELPADLLRRAGVRLLPRAPRADLAVTRVTGPSRATAGDSITLEVELRSFGRGPDTVTVEARFGSRVLARRRLVLRQDATEATTLAVGTAGLSGDVLLAVGLAAVADAEPRDDARLHLLRVSPTPGIVFLANPPDWDSRTLFQALRGVAELPIRAYLRLDARGWRRMGTLAPVSEDEVLQAARRADLLVVKGRAPEQLRGSMARARWLWPSGEGGEAAVPGEWYPASTPPSPVASVFVGLPLESLPPLVSVTPIEPGPEEWVGITAQLGRRGSDRPVFAGRAGAGRREVLTAADGFWRWSFRGGTGEQAYRGLVAGTISWLLGAPDSAAGRARLVRPVTSNGRPVVFQWAAPGPPAPLGISLPHAGGAGRDTLRFDGSGQAELWLPPGVYPYQLDGGGRGTAVVDTWSEEWLPREPRLTGREVPAVDSHRSSSSRRWLWLFGLALGGLSVEWYFRRRLGLR